MTLKTKPLQKFCDNFKNDIVDGPFGSNLKKADYIKSGIPVLKIQNIKPFRIIDKKMNYISDEKYKELLRHSFKPEDLVMTKLGNPLGITSIIPPEYEKGVIVADLVRIRVNNSINKKFLCYALNSPVTINYINSKQKGTTRPRVRIGIVRELPIPDVSLEMQGLIVAEIETQFTRLDSAIKSLQTIKKKLEVYRKSLLLSAFKGKLIYAKFVKKKIGDLYKLIDGDRGKNYPKKSDFFEMEHCLFLTTKNVRPNGFKFEKIQFINKQKDEELNAGKLSRGDLVLTTRGTLGNVGIYDESIEYKHIRINSGMLILRDNTKEVKNNYLIHYIQSPLFITQLNYMRSGTAQPQIPVRVLKNIEIYFPKNPELQEKIVQEIETQFSVIDKLDETVDASLLKAETLKKSILKSAFEGKLVEMND